MKHRCATASLVSALLLAGCATTPPAEDPVLIKLTEIEDRLDRVERVTANDSLVQMASQVDEMQRELRELRGEVETLRFEDQAAADRQRDQYLDLDRRLQGVEGGGARAPSPSVGGAAIAGSTAAGAATSAAAGGPAGSDRARYEAAFELLKEGRYEDARGAFERYLADYPDSDLAGHSQYWLAETYYVSQDYKAALPQFRKVVSDYGTSRKLPDALLKIGYCQVELGQLDSARRTLRDVVSKYPETTAARLASQRLEQLGAG
jgi:tol-pal system protein YbgF